MPRYIYDCSACNEQFEVSHGMFFEQSECILCGRKETLTKVPSFTIKREVSENTSQPVGKVVDEFIVEAKKDLKKQRQELKTEYVDK
jgi:putative FmdB family regulatory protein